ncbi:hypothetical protein C0581_00480 [Candidatus Parcubacteria bacterium]|nr:MAG: hypothetical protein C0581_00480 [Candidatus Parcubacteria bacterium]
MKKTAYFALGSLAALAVLVVGSMATSAATNPGNGEGQQKEFRGQKGNMEHREEMKEFTANATYDEWVAKVTEIASEKGHEPKMLENITAENFDQFKQMHELMQSGDRDGAKAIAAELGLPQMGRQGMKGQHRMGDGEGRQFRDINGDGVCDRADVDLE